MSTHRKFTPLALAILCLLAVPAAKAVTYWACNEGYSWQVDNQAARCLKPETTVYKPLLPCPAGSFIAIDALNNGGDQCQGPNANVKINPGCPSGYQWDKEPGPDRCKRVVPAESIPPSRTVQR